MFAHIYACPYPPTKTCPHPHIRTHRSQCVWVGEVARRMRFRTPPHPHPHPLHTHLVCLELCFVDVCSEEFGQLITTGERTQVHHWTSLDLREETFNDASFLALVLSVVCTGCCQRLSGLLTPLFTLQTVEKTIPHNTFNIHMFVCTYMQAKCTKWRNEPRTILPSPAPFSPD